MPKEADHEENRRKVSILCGSKIVFGKSKASVFNLKEKLHKPICKYKFDKSDSRYPTSICGNCRPVLFDREKDVFKRNFPVTPQFDKIVLHAKIRNTTQICNCFLCQTARHKGHKSSSVVKVGTMGHEVTNQKQKFEPICQICFQKTGKRIRHNCSKTYAYRNVKDIVQKLKKKPTKGACCSVFVEILH
ncbi:unnamed protein product [Brassicogethes aeneus]|uniref:Uncharacterized protein n=1 Tax=Brassicogethes aeneus TaxID=1431903 RepID=A0A9P0BE43_BRAAE|nr:unnamed protein product [Brassicogethes aeneus]